MFNSGPTKEEAGVQTVEAQEDDQSTGEAALWGKTEGAQSFGPEEKIRGDLHQNIPVMMGAEGTVALSSQLHDQVVHSSV